jgi:hypothetical protein
MEIVGLSPVGTVYEYLGHVLCLRLGTLLLWQGYFVLFVVGAALLRLYYLGSREGSFAELAVYPFTVGLILFLLYPVDVRLTAPRAPGPSVSGQPVGPGDAQTVQVPRLLAVTSSLMDALQRSLISDVRGRVGPALQEWARIAAVNQEARLFGPALKDDLGSYLKYCYWPSLTPDGSPQGDPWTLVPLSGLPVDDWLLGQYQSMALEAPRKSAPPGPVPCATLHQELASGVGRELQSDPVHQQAQGAYLAVGVSGADASSFYRRRILYNEIFVRSGSEAAALRQALPEYSAWDSTTASVQIKESTKLSDNVWNVVGNLAGEAISLASAAGEWWSQKALGPATIYRVSAMGPHIYGMVLAILLFLFPVAGLLAFWPKWASALPNFMKLFLSVKLWPILWAFISAVLSSRTVFDGSSARGFDSGLGSGGLFPALCSIYLIVPMLSFMIVNIAQHAAGGLLGSLIAGTEGASIGVAGRMAGTGAAGLSRAGGLAGSAFNHLRPSARGAGKLESPEAENV